MPSSAHVRRLYMVVRSPVVEAIAPSGRESMVAVRCADGRSCSLQSRMRHAGIERCASVATGSTPHIASAFMSAFDMRHAPRRLSAPAPCASVYRPPASVMQIQKQPGTAPFVKCCNRYRERNDVQNESVRERPRGRRWTRSLHAERVTATPGRRQGSRYRRRTSGSVEA